MLSLLVAVRFIHRNWRTDQIWITYHNCWA